MEHVQNQRIYDSHSEKELIASWEEEVVGTNTKSCNRLLMKEIGKNEEDVEGNNIPVNTRQMYDSKSNSWIPYDFWFGLVVVNDRKEQILARIWEAAPYQPEFGKTLYGWKTLNTDLLQSILEKKESAIDQFNQKTLVGNRNEFYEVIKQDRQEKRNEGDYSDIRWVSRNNRRI